MTRGRSPERKGAKVGRDGLVEEPDIELVEWAMLLAQGWPDAVKLGLAQIFCFTPRRAAAQRNRPVLGDYNPALAGCVRIRPLSLSSLRELMQHSSRDSARRSRAARAAILIAAASLVAPASAPRLDLDVGIPPGSPTTWGRRFPAITPPRRPLFPKTPRPGAAGHTVVSARAAEPDVRLADSFGIVRILTWDIPAHLPWVSDLPAKKGPVTGGSAKEAPLPRPGDAMYWTTIASLLRLLLHPQLVSQQELIAHLVEVGEPVMGALEAAKAEEGLKEVCSVLEAKIGSGRRAARPLPGSTPRETMMNRFVAEELVSTHPYDPEGGFGRRLFLFADEVEPLLARYATHEDSFLRRNAVAALARYHTAEAMEALIGIAIDTDDPVVLMRSLSALGSYKSAVDATPLLARLEKATDPVEVVALIEAIGRTAVIKAVPTLLKLGAKGWKGDSDLLQAVMAAFVHMGVAIVDDEVVRLGRRVATADAARFRVVPAVPGPSPDIIDKKVTRGEILGQLALLLRARMKRGDTDAAARVVALLGEKRSKPGGVRYAGPYSNRSLEAIHPPVRFLFLETLPLLDDVGISALGWVADDVSVEPPLRGYALSLLPAEARGPRAAKVLEDPEAEPEMKVYALDVLQGDGHLRTEDLARKVLAGALVPGVEYSPALRYLWMRAVRVLSERGLFSTEDVLPLMRLVAVPAAGEDPRSHAIRLLKELIAEVPDLRRVALRKRILAILDLMIEHKVSPVVRAGTRNKLRQRMEVELATLKKKPVSDDAQVAMVNALQAMLMGQPRDQAEFEPVVLLENEILFALGRTATAAAVQALVDFQRDHPGSQHLGPSCLALGLTGHQAASMPLVRMLLHRDGFTRLCAYESLRRLTNREHFADWLYGEPRERTVAAERFYRWLRK